MGRRIPTDTFLATEDDGTEIALITAVTIEDAKETMKEEYSRDGGYFLRRLTEEAMQARQISVNPATTPDLYY